MKTWGGDGWMLVWKLERARVTHGRKTLPPISLAPAPRAGSSTPPSSENFHKASPWLLGNLAKGLTQIALLQAQLQNPGPVPALEPQGPTETTASGPRWVRKEGLWGWHGAAEAR